MSKQNSEIVSGSVSIQNICFSLPSNDTFLFQLVHEVSPYMLGFQTYIFPNIQGFLKYITTFELNRVCGRPDPRKKLNSGMSGRPSKTIP